MGKQARRERRQRRDRRDTTPGSERWLGCSDSPSEHVTNMCGTFSSLSRSPEVGRCVGGVGTRTAACAAHHWYRRAQPREPHHVRFTPCGPLRDPVQPAHHSGELGVRSSPLPVLQRPTRPVERPESPSSPPKNSSKLGSPKALSNSSKPYAHKLGKDGKLTSEEHQHRFANHCLFCGGAGHNVDTCPKKSTAAKAMGAPAAPEKPLAGKEPKN